MKKDKKRIRGALVEGLIEVVLTLLCFGIGVFIISLFGVNLDSPNIDGDLIVLLGIVVPVVIFGTVSALVQWFKKIIGGKRK